MTNRNTAFRKTLLDTATVFAIATATELFTLWLTDATLTTVLASLQIAKDMAIGAVAALLINWHHTR